MKNTLSLLACASALLTASASHAALYQVTVNTQPLVGNANAPFYVDFQMNYGSGPGNRAAISDFTGGTPVGGAFSYNGLGDGAIGAFGTAAGNLGTGVTISDSPSSPFNGFFQEFTPGSTLKFLVSISANGTGLTPDDFIFSIDDSTTFQIPTTSLDGVSLAYFQINPSVRSPSTPAIAVNTYTFAPGDAGDDIAGVTVSVVAVPEPATYGALAGVGLLAFSLRGQLRRRQIAS